MAGLLDEKTLSEKFKNEFNMANVNLEAWVMPQLSCNGLAVSKPLPALYKTEVCDDLTLYVGDLLVKEPTTNEIECSQQ